MKNLTVAGTVLCLILALMACNNSAEQKVQAETNVPAVAPVPPGPPFENINVTSFREKMDDDNVVILDVRTPGEVKDGMIDGAINIDFMDPEFMGKVSGMDKNKTYLVYCQSGGRSARACKMMSESGFKNLYNMKEGYMGWTD